MRANEKRRALYDAVSAIDPKLVQEATAPRHRKVTRIVWRVAACAAVVALLIGAMAVLPLGFGEDEEYVTAPGGLTIRTYALNENEISDVNSTVLTEGVELPWEYTYSLAINVLQGLPIKLDIPDAAYPGMDISLRITTSGGSFEIFNEDCYWDPETKQIVGQPYKNVGSEIIVSNNTTLYWDCYEMKHSLWEGEYKDYNIPQVSYVDITILADKNIVGYAVVRIYEVFPPGETGFDAEVAYGYLATVDKIVSFPQIDGKFQPVSRRYVEQKFEELHRSAGSPLSTGGPHDCGAE
jgi:hypothetical protein